jgi:hypothetical protein
MRDLDRSPSPRCRTRWAFPICLSLLLFLEPGPLDADDAGEAAFEEVSAEVGLVYRHFNGMSGKLYTPEVMGPGVALFDYDNDGDLDVYLGQGNLLDEAPPQDLVFAPPGPLPLTHRLFRNDLGVPTGSKTTLHFTDVTEASGLVATGYNMGVATGDYDNDGWLDVYATNLGSNHLLRNRGDGTFVDVTESAGADDRRWSVPASFFDFDGDGWLDLFVGNYHHFRVADDKPCFLPNGMLDYCGPLAQPPEEHRLLRNRGDGTFEDVTARAGLAGAAATALGAVAADFSGDGLIDLFVANDLMANFLWVNQGNGTFVDDALLLGAALDANGQPQANMGVVAEDLTGDGAIDIFVTHLLREYNTLFVNDGSGMFTDRSWASGLAAPSWDMTGFGTVMLDYDGDGIEDLFVVNGAVHRVPEQVRAGDLHPLREQNQLFRGLGDGRFEEVPAASREHPVYQDVGRGLAVGDLDNDGDSDLVITNNAGPVRVLLNRREPGGRWLGLRLLERTGKRDAFGARAAIGVSSGAGPRHWRRVHTDGSYTAASDPRLLFVASGEGVVDVLVSWPDGPSPTGDGPALEQFDGVSPGRYSTLRQGTGRAVQTAPAPAPGKRPEP